MRALWSVCFDHLFSYHAEKTAFERKHFRLRDYKTVAEVNNEGNIVQHTPAVLGSSETRSYWGIIAPNAPHHRETELDDYILECAQENGRFKELSFIKRWLADPHARTFACMDSIPPARNRSMQETTPPGVFNTWPGLCAENLPQVPEETVAELVQPILDHLRDVVTGPQHIGFLLAWLAQQVQDPAHHTQVMIILQGLQGAGKNIILDFFRDRVLGEGVAFKTSNPSKDIFGGHSVALRDRIFVNLDELSSDDIRPLMPRLKDLVTSSTVHVNPKNQPAFDVRNLANILATSNHINPIHIEPQERRIVVFACNSSKKGDTAYFEGLVAHLSREDVARAFFQHLRDNVDVAPFLPFQSHRPLTAAYAAMQERNIPLLYKFLSAVVRQAHEKGSDFNDVKASTLHAQFLHWGRSGNYNMGTATVSKFGADLTGLIKELEEKDPQQHTLTKKRRGAAFFYTVRWAKLRTHLQETARYDPESNAECDFF